MATVVINGCFDCLHVGHLEIIREAYFLSNQNTSNLDYIKSSVIVLLDSDEKIKKDKGNKRPIFSYNERMRALLSTGYIDEVLKFNTNEELLNFMQVICPDYIVKGEDWKDKHVVGSELYDVEIKYVRKTIDISTSEIEKRVLEKNNV